MQINQATRQSSTVEYTRPTEINVGARSKDTSSELIQALDLAYAKHPEVSNDATARSINSDLMNALDLAVEQSAADMLHLPADARQTLEMLQDYIVTGNFPDRGQFSETSMVAEVMNEIEQDAHISATISPSVYSDQPTPEVVERLNTVLEFGASVLRNEFEDPNARRAANVTNVALRNVISVGIPTFIKQATAYAIENALVSGGASVAARTALASLAGAFPLVLNAIGLARDNINGVATTASNISRALNISIGVAGLAAAGATGSLPALAATLAAYNIVYCGQRQAIQAYLPLVDNGGSENGKALLGSTLASLPNELATNQGMSHLATPSGAGAVAEGLWPVGNDLVRAALATANATLGDLAADGIKHHFTNKETHTENPPIALTLMRNSAMGEARRADVENPNIDTELETTRANGPESLRIALEAGRVSKSDATNILLNLYATRASVTNNTIVLGAMLSKLASDYGLSEVFPTLVPDTIYAVVAAAQYAPFALSLAQATDTKYVLGDIESRGRGNFRQIIDEID